MVDTESELVRVSSATDPPDSPDVHRDLDTVQTPRGEGEERGRDNYPSVLRCLQ